VAAGWATATGAAAGAWCEEVGADCSAAQLSTQELQGSLRLAGGLAQARAQPWARGLVIGGIGFGGGAWTILIAQWFTDPVTVAIIAASTPLAATLVAWWYDRQPLTPGFTLGLLAVAPLARIVRAQTMSLREREFVLAARSLGAKPGRVILREILPNLIPAILTVAFTGLSIIIAAEGALAFLGLGVEIGTPTWGKLINDNRNQIDVAWWATFFPCLMLFLTVVSFNVIGDRLSRRFDIRQAGV
jgi:peptide/nickel transport system permease protein